MIGLLIIFAVCVLIGCGLYVYGEIMAERECGDS